MIIKCSEKLYINTNYVQSFEIAKNVYGKYYIYARMASKDDKIIGEYANVEDAELELNKVVSVFVEGWPFHSMTENGGNEND